MLRLFMPFDAAMLILPAFDDILPMPLFAPLLLLIMR